MVRSKSTTRPSPSVKKQLKKHVAVIHVAAPFGHLERKLYNILLLQAYDDLPADRTHEIPAQLLFSLLGWTQSQNTDDLRDAIAKIVSTEVQFNLLGDEEGKDAPRWETTTMMSYGSIQGGVVSWRYDQAMSRKLYEPSVYATISLATQQHLASAFSYALYENCVRFRKAGQRRSTGWWSVELFRQLLNATAPTYDEFKYLSKRVIEPCVAEINQRTDILIAVEYHRTGRRVTSLRFSVEETKQPSLLSVNLEDLAISSTEEVAIARMERLQIKRKLATSIVREYDSVHLEQTLRYIESELRDGKVRTSSGGYFLTMLKQPQSVTQKVNSASVAARPQAQQIVQFDQLPTAAQARASSPWSVAMQERLDGLTREQRRQLSIEFIEANPHTAQYFNTEDGLCTHKITILQFRAWLAKRDQLTVES